jgi:GNAT superfamily N-acetyltransferase
VPLRVERVLDESRGRAFHAISAEASPLDHAGKRAEPIEDLLGVLPDGTPTERLEFFVGYTAADAVAVGVVVIPLVENLHLAHTWACVHPDARRRGYGREMATFLLDRCREHGRHTVTSWIGAPIGSTAPGDHLARSLGASPALESVRRAIHMRDVDEGALARMLDEEVRPASGGYDLVQWLDRAPDAYVAGAAALLPHVGSDSPRGDLDLEDEVWDVTRFHEYEETIAKRGRRLAVTAAAERATGQLVAYTELTVPVSVPEEASQWGTIVEAAHRGHRLGLRVKIENLLLVRATFPAVEEIITFNAVENRHMIEVNERMGFRPVERYRAWQLRM